MSFRRMMALLLSAMLLLMPALSSAEGLGFSAGDLTGTTLYESYYGGYQINVGFGFDVNAEALAVGGEKVQAVAELLDMAQVHLSFYDDFGTARIRGNVTLDGVEVVSGDMLIMEDGSVQLVTSLTGNMAFTLPAGTVTEYGITLPEREAQKPVEELTAFERLPGSAENMGSTLINLLLGWVSSTQMKTGELYAFDYETYIDATETRDAVATRMIGKINGDDLVRFLWNIASHICDNEWEFMEVAAGCLAELGVTSYDFRQVVDALFPDEEMVANVDMVVTSEYIKDDGSLCNFYDVHYLMRKISKSLMNAWGTNATKEVSSMIVGYDDMGAMVGFDVELKRFTKSYPYEGNFVYSILTDDNWQRLHTSHGELQVYGNNRVIGDLHMQFGEDVDGVNASHLIGQLDIVNQTTGESTGIAVNSGLDFTITPDGQGESIEARADLLLNADAQSTPLLDADLSAVSTLTDLGLTLTGALNVGVVGQNVATVNVSVDCIEYVDEAFEGGQAVDLANELTQEQIDAIKDEVKGEAAGLAVKFALKPAVLGNLLKLTQ